MIFFFNPEYVTNVRYIDANKIVCYAIRKRSFFCDLFSKDEHTVFFRSFEDQKKLIPESISPKEFLNYFMSVVKIPVAFHLLNVLVS